MNKWQEVSSLVNTLSQLGLARRHLFQAGREMLLLLQSLIDLAGGYTEGLKPTKTVVTTKEVLEQVKGLTSAVLDKFPDGKKEEAEETRRAVFQSILGVLNDERERFLRASSPKVQLKREALETIIAILQKEMEGKKGKNHDAAANT